MGKGSIFSFLLAENIREIGDIISEFPVRSKFGKYTLCTDATTPYASASCGNVCCGIFGLAVNVITGSSTDLPVEIAETCESISEVLEYEKQLGGKYLILFQTGEQYYALGDATCSIPIFYNTTGSFLCADNGHSIVQIKNYPVDKEYGAIRNNGDISQAMPYDITPYRQIRQLIPNHYLDLNRQTAVRFLNSRQPQKELSVTEATDAVLPMIENLLDFYLQKYKIYCPITAGRDSRVVLSFLLKSKKDFSCYTIRHPEHHAQAQDIIVPVRLCKKINIPHKLVEDVTVPHSLKAHMDRLLGEGQYSSRTLRIGQTIETYFGDGAMINGDIIGQVGKCSLHRDIPAIFATPSYFRCKLHNYSKGAKQQLKLWLKEITDSGEKVNTFDLFSIENRMGRWATQTGLVYHALGQPYLNIFNSRSILYIWTAVDRKSRKQSLIHTALIERSYSTLCEIPFEQDNSLTVRISKANWGTYFVSSYLKYFLEKGKYFLKGGNQT